MGAPNTHIAMDLTKILPQRLEATLSQLSASIAELRALFDTMSSLKDADTPAITDYVTITALFGYTSTAKAQTSWNEINAVLGNAEAAIHQAAAYHRQ